MESQTPLNHKASQETMISLLQLDPQPIESPNEKPLPPLPEQSLESSTSSLEAESKSKSGTSSPHSSALGLSGSGHGPVYYLTRIQRYSSYTFTVFAGLHMVNTSIVPLIYNSVPYSEPFLLMAREIYQTRLSEPLLVGLPIVAHVASGLALRLIRRSQNLKRYGGATPGMLHSHSPVVAHIFLNRILPLIVEGDSSNIGLQYVSHGFARHGLQPWIAYALLLTAGAGHFVWGWAKWLNLAPPMNWRKTTVDKALRKRRSRAWWGINGLAALVAGVWAAGGLGVVARGGAAYGWLGKVYDAIYARAGQ
ncbi:hypothetical protein BKA67DRAFT_655687 [Truncatella angustata]|uniref:Mitochondrial adapter protein MCP1 transmembrane domain-containing protein n=1 Tax=Truncatella angustata TaxID=152316 RepID=A0A9P8UR21_9PEZI|nr:uncharacterized protein BKA67DRAFT_655687 [Truncatella angustata]KAH6657415.1 hypothetical protein BKA67DRAFT_655687 [Truncatella angustata]